MLNPQNIGPKEEQYEYYKDRITKKRRCQYDYRDANGELFSTIAPTLEIARTKRDKWIEKMGGIRYEK